MMGEAESRKKEKLMIDWFVEDVDSFGHFFICDGDRRGESKDISVWDFET